MSPSILPLTHPPLILLENALVLQQSLLKNGGGIKVKDVWCLITDFLQPHKAQSTTCKHCKDCKGCVTYRLESERARAQF
ncbi:hypothetical protein Plhal304r1_c042g0122291 [Plasmopara halstedii]